MLFAVAPLYLENRCEHVAGAAHICKPAAPCPLRPLITPASLSVSLTHDIKRFRGSVSVETTTIF